MLSGTAEHVWEEKLRAIREDEETAINCGVFFSKQNPSGRPGWEECLLISMEDVWLLKWRAILHCSDKVLIPPPKATAGTFRLIIHNWWWNEAQCALKVAGV